MSTNLSAALSQPLEIAGRPVAPRLTLAPLTGLGHVAFRELLARFGGYGLLFSEMCSARRIPHERPETSPCFRWREAERDRLVIQILGDDPGTMAEAARRVEGAGLFGVDLNFGCSVSAIRRHGGGAALLTDPDRAGRIVAAVRRAVACPLFVKFRTGWTDDPAVPVALARRFAEAGADALTFHPRVAPDRRSRPPRWKYIGRVKEAVGVPVFGNGDVFDADDCRRMLDTTRCDGVAVGRMAVARPWIFAQWTAGFDPPPELYFETVREVIRLLDAHFDPGQALRRFKRFARYFAANFTFGHTFFAGIQNAPDMASAWRAAERFFDTPPAIASRPNVNLFAG